MSDNIIRDVAAVIALAAIMWFCLTVAFLF